MPELRMFVWSTAYKRRRMDDGQQFYLSARNLPPTSPAGLMCHFYCAPAGDGKQHKQGARYSLHALIKTCRSLRIKHFNGHCSDRQYLRVFNVDSGKGLDG